MIRSMNKMMIRSVDVRVDATSMNRWVNRVLEASLVRDPSYHAVFQGKNLDNHETLIGAVGRQLGMRVMIAKTEVYGEIDLNGEIVYKVTHTCETEFSSTPFRLVFDTCRELHNELKKILDPKYKVVPFLGGMKSIVINDNPQEIANYYLPEISIFDIGDGFKLFCAYDLPEEAFGFAEETGTDRKFDLTINKTDLPDYKTYVNQMKYVLNQLKNGDLEKIVVSRKCTALLSDQFCLEDYISYLHKNYYQEYFYVFKQGDQNLWVGISPEVIMKQKEGVARTEPLAGTRKKSNNEDENAITRKNLASTTKDITEHNYVLESMVKQLEKANIGDVSVKGDKLLLETPYAFHLKSTLEIKLNKEIAFFDLIGAMYPPATVWGIPVDKIENVLKVVEPFPREYFTGIFGYWNFDNSSNMALVIRTVMINDCTINAFAGGGIIKYSNPDDEFTETVNKMRPLFSYFKQI